MGLVKMSSRAGRYTSNIPLPDSERDEHGKPIHQYARNKIRTAKYTPISFIPKNLYYQFHNIANVFFFIIIILGVRVTFNILNVCVLC